MDAANRVVSQVLIRNGRFAAVGNNVVRRAGGLRVVDLGERPSSPASSTRTTTSSSSATGRDGTRRSSTS